MTVEVPEIPRTDKLELVADKTALIVVDMQNDFAHEDGSLFTPDAPATIPTIADLLKRARAAGSRVVYTQDWHPKGDPEFDIWPVHVLENSWGAEIVDELKPQQGETVLRKARYDGFYGTPLGHLLHLWNVEHVIVTGTVANICVLHTAGSAALRWFDVVLPEDAVSAVTPFDMLAALRQITFLYQGEVTTTSGISFV